MSKETRIDRKELKNPDEFVQKGRQFLQFLLEQRARLLSIFAVAAVIGLGVYTYDWIQTRNIEKAWKAYHIAMKSAEDKRWDELKKVLEEHGNNRATYLAALALADHYYELRLNGLIEGKNDSVPSAIEWYDRALRLEKDLLPFEKQLLWINRGKAYELEKKYDEALVDYDRAGALAGEAKAVGLLSAGRLYELKGQPEKARELYERVAADFPNTDFARMARNEVRRLRGALLKG